MIWNKKLEHTTKIYDLQNNTLYENKDISYGIADETFDINAFIKEANEQVKKKAVVIQPTGSYGGGYGGSSYGGNYYSGYSGNNGSGYGKKNETVKGGGSKAKEKQKGKAEYGGGWQGRGSELMEDEAFDFRDRFNT